MKTVFINGSPKKRFSASSYFISIQKCFVKGEKVIETLKSRKDHERILSALKDADTVVFSLPLYVDGVPSHVLSFLKEMEIYCQKNHLNLNVYAIANNGFIEGIQSEALLQVFRNFCAKSGLKWGGGIGIGGGVMFTLV